MEIMLCVKTALLLNVYHVCVGSAVTQRTECYFSAYNGADLQEPSVHCFHVLCITATLSDHANKQTKAIANLLLTAVMKYVDLSFVLSKSDLTQTHAAF